MDDTAVPALGHNQPSARNYLEQMRHAARLFVSSNRAAEDHLLTVIEQAYRLRAYREEDDKHRDEVDGLLGKRKIADTARSSIFTRLLKLAFHDDERERSRISRCAAALQHAWNEKTQADDLRTFIDKQGGIVKCGDKLKGTENGNADRPRPKAVPVPCDLTLDMQGHASVTGTMKKTAAGWEFLPSKVLSPVRQRGARPRVAPRTQHKGAG